MDFATVGWFGRGFFDGLREQLGRDRYDQGAFAKARSTFGDTTSPQASAFIEEARKTAVLSDARSTLTDAFSSFVTALSHGTSAADAFSSALSRLGDKLISGAIDSLVGSAFKSGGGDLFGGIGKLFGFADGGFTGYGGKYEPAGFVHKGEYVMDAATVGRFGRGFFDGLRGYADGGFVEMPDMKAPLTPISAANDPVSQSGNQHHYDFRGSNLTRADAEHIAARVAVRVTEANNQEQRRTQFDRLKTDKRAFG